MKFITLTLNLFLCLQVLRDPTRRRHRLHDKTENDRQICLVDADYYGKIVEIEMEEIHDDKLQNTA